MRNLNTVQKEPNESRILTRKDVLLAGSAALAGLILPPRPATAVQTSDSAPQRASGPDSRDLGIWRQVNVRPYFVNFGTFYSFSGSTPQPKFVPSLPEGRFINAINSSYRCMIESNMDVIPGETVEALGTRIRKNFDQMLSRQGLTSVEKTTKDWLLAEAVCAWVSTHVVNAKDIPDGATDAKERIRRGQAQVVLDQRPPSAVCSGFTRLTRDLARSVGLNCEHIGGDYRGPGQPAPLQSNHGWVVFKFDNGVAVPADTTLGRVDLAVARRENSKLNEELVLPRTPVALEIFLSEHIAYQTLDGLGKYKVTPDDCNRIDKVTWGQVNTAYFSPAKKAFRDYQRTRNRRFSVEPSPRDDSK